ncbi:hypothetical protein HDU99_008497 [Rhizoclosmatium hyalinum]|nr:hypothetical protein HDU99_008497 [Rhizoclosmatium hyalinum]
MATPPDPDSVKRDIVSKFGEKVQGAKRGFDEIDDADEGAILLHLRAQAHSAALIHKLLLQNLAFSSDTAVRVTNLETAFKQSKPDGPHPLQWEELQPELGAAMVLVTRSNIYIDREGATAALLTWLDNQAATTRYDKGKQSVKLIFTNYCAPKVLEIARKARVALTQKVEVRINTQFRVPTGLTVTQSTKTEEMIRVFTSHSTIQTATQLLLVNRLSDSGPFLTLITSLAPVGGLTDDETQFVFATTNLYLNGGSRDNVDVVKALMEEYKNAPCVEGVNANPPQPIAPTPNILAPAAMFDYGSD